MAVEAMIGRLRAWWRRVRRHTVVPAPSPTASAPSVGVQQTAGGACPDSTVATVAPPPAPGAPSPLTRVPDGHRRPLVSPLSPSPGSDPHVPQPEGAIPPRASTPAPTRIRRGHKLGSSGYGSVYEVKGDPTLAFKQYKTPVPNVLPAFDQLIAAGVDVRRSLRGAPVDLAWPTAAVPEGDELAGCLMPKVHSRYTVNVQGLTREATLDHAVPRLDSHFAPSRQPSDGERRMLAVAAGQFLHALHENDYVYGDVSWKNLLYALDPVPSVMVLDLDSIRRVGTTPWPGVGAHTADWGDPHGQPGEVGAFDEDRYKYALLVYRLLAARSLTAQMPATGDITWHADVDDRQSRRLTRLTWRAKARLERPAVSEWLAVLA